MSEAGNTDVTPMTEPSEGAGWAQGPGGALLGKLIAEAFGRAAPHDPAEPEDES